jgi:acetyltransferase-like isoleucine patch superfamily enzyme
MVATRFENIDRTDNAYSFIDYRAKIHPSARIEPFCVIDDGVEIGENTLIGPFNHIRPGTKIGAGCRIGGHSTFEGNCEIGSRVRMGTHCNVGWGCSIGDDVFIGGNFTGANDKKMMWLRGDFKPTGYTIMHGARLGLSVTLMPGIIIGYDALIGAGSLVTRSVPRREIWYGNPARKRGQVPQDQWLDKTIS